MAVCSRMQPLPAGSAHPLCRPWFSEPYLSRFSSNTSRGAGGPPLEAQAAVRCPRWAAACRSGLLAPPWPRPAQRHARLMRENVPAAGAWCRPSRLPGRRSWTAAPGRPSSWVSRCCAERAGVGLNLLGGAGRSLISGPACDPAGIRAGAPPDSPGRAAEHGTGAEVVPSARPPARPPAPPSQTSS